MRLKQGAMREYHKGKSDPTTMKEMTRIHSSLRKDQSRATTYLHLYALHRIQEEEKNDHHKTVLCVTTVLIVVDLQILEEYPEWRATT